jgi:invasion protein IalB
VVAAKRGRGRILLWTGAGVAVAAACAVAAFGSGGGAGVARGFIGTADFGAWRLICVRGPAALDGLVEPANAVKTNACRINQEVPLAQSADAVLLAANFSLVGARKTPALMLRLPSTAQGSEAVGLRLDDGREVKAAVGDCAGGQCIAASTLSADEWKELLDAKTVQVRFAVAGGQMVLVELKRDGLAEAVAAMMRADGA